MRNKLTCLGFSALVLTFALSSGAAYARNILPDAFNDLNNPSGPRQSPYTDYGRTSSTVSGARFSSIDEPISASRPGAGPFSEVSRRAGRLMDRAVRRYEKGEFEAACKLATEASAMVSESQFTSGSALDSYYSELSMKICQAAQNA